MYYHLTQGRFSPAHFDAALAGCIISIELRYLLSLHWTFLQPPSQEAPHIHKANSAIGLSYTGS